MRSTDAQKAELKAAISRVLRATWQRCRVGLLKSRLALIRSLLQRAWADSMLGSKLRWQSEFLMAGSLRDRRASARVSQRAR